MHPILYSLAAKGATTAPLIREGLRTEPMKHSATDAVKEKLKTAYDQRLSDLKITERLPMVFNEGHPTANGGLDLRQIGSHERLRQRVDDDGNVTPDRPIIADKVNYNKNADSAVLAHEMGHAVSSKTKVGKAIRNMRENPKLAMALAAASGVVPLTAAVLTPGDDEYDEAILGTMALAAPTLIDEGLATKNALAMMETADMRATLGQRGKLATGLLSYVAAPMMTASLTTALGNQFDTDPVQTSSTLMP